MALLPGVQSWEATSREVICADMIKYDIEQGRRLTSNVTIRSVQPIYISARVYERTACHSYHEEKHALLVQLTQEAYQDLKKLDRTDAMRLQEFTLAVQDTCNL